MNDEVSYPIPGDIGQVVVGAYRRRLTVELDVQAVRELPASVVSKRVIIATQRALASAGRDDGVIELFPGDPSDFSDVSSSGLEPLARGDA